jgi:hypothetical protein
VRCKSHAAKVKLLSNLAESDAGDPEVRRLAESIVAGARSEDEQVRRLHAFVQGRVLFTREHRETFSHTLRTLDVGLGDCDDSARALVALLRSLGMQAGMLTLPERGTPTHVGAAVKTKDGWRWLETTIAARAYEHPLAAAKRLGIKTRADLGALGEMSDEGYMFRAGRTYVAGVNKPAVLSVDTIAEAVEERGFGVVGIWEREQLPAFPFVLPPHEDDWDYVGVAVRTGPDEAIEVPSRVRWLVDTSSGAVTIAPGGRGGGRAYAALAAAGLFAAGLAAAVRFG